MIRILLVDDQNLIIQIIQVLLENDPNFKIIGIAQDGRTAVEEAAKLQPDIVLIDLEMPKMNGITATEYLSCLVPQAKVIVLTSHEREQYLIKALKAGAKGYLLKNSSAEDLKKAIITVNQGYSQIGSKLLAKIVEARKVRKPSQTKLIKPTLTLADSANTEHTDNIAKKKAISAKNRQLPHQTKFDHTQSNFLSRLLPFIYKRSPLKVNRVSLSPILEDSTVVTQTVPHQKGWLPRYLWKRPWLEKPRWRHPRSPRMRETAAGLPPTSSGLSIIKLLKFRGLSKILLVVLGVIISLTVL